MPSIDANINFQEEDEAANKMMSNGLNESRMRHVEIRHRIARDAVDGEVDWLEYVTSGGAWRGRSRQDIIRMLRFTKEEEISVECLQPEVGREFVTIRIPKAGSMPVYVSPLRR